MDFVIDPVLIIVYTEKYSSGTRMCTSYDFDKYLISVLYPYLMN